MKTGSVKYSIGSQTGLRFDASFHLSEGLVVKRKIASSPFEMLTIKDVTSDIFYGNRAKRVYVTKRENGIPFLSSSDILQADLENVKLASKKYTPCIEQMKLKKGWTLISRSGTIGNCAFANAKHAQKLASEDVIRLVPNNILRGGLVYAYLASNHGHSLLTQGTFGAVIQHIEPNFIASLPIPKFPEAFQQEVDNLIQESARLREEATDALKEAHNMIEHKFLIEGEKKSYCVPITSILASHNKRFEASYHTSRNRSIYDYITQNFEYKKLGELTERIFRPGIFKREYVSNGVTFLGGADILMAIPNSDKKLSFRQVKKMPELKVKKDWILVTCGGTIGNTVLIDSQLEECVISQHVMRVVPKEDVLKGYLYAVLSSRVGHELITLFTTGSVIPQIESHHLDLVPIPLLDKQEMEKIDRLVFTYVSKIEISKEKETRAISMVEDEIEKWNS
ncbi:MAG: restriction endonuclease subunit S [Bacteroidaceae bacterium]|nr:restriction endonuclease subunit S [Bacteroidaceae bacterium]